MPTPNDFDDNASARTASAPTPGSPGLARWRLGLGACMLALAVGVVNWSAVHMRRAPGAATTVPGFEPVLPHTRQFDLRANANGQMYRVFVALPEGPAPQHGYPVLYVLDGNTLFDTAVSAARAQAGGAHGTPLVVVGVGYPSGPHYDEKRRYLDFTPPTLGGRIKTALHWPQRFKTGGQDDFYDFLDTQVKPAVARLLPVDPARETLFAHSLGGLFALHVLFTHPGTFDAYVAASPSIWWHDRSILAEERRFEAEPRAARVPRVLLMVGGAEQDRRPATGTPAPGGKPVFSSRMVDNAVEMAGRLAPGRGAGARAEFHVFPGQTHMSYFPEAFEAAIQFALEQPGAAGVHRAGD